MIRRTSLLVLCASLAACAGGPQPGPEIPTAVSVLQRSSSRVSTPHGPMRLTIGDITRGRVIVTLSDEDGNGAPIYRRAMGLGDSVPYRVDDHRSVLGLSRLHNRLIGDDHAVFHIGSAEAVAAEQIRHVIDQVTRSNLTFVVEGIECEGASAGLELRERWDAASEPYESAAEFLDVLERLEQDGHPTFQVKIGDNAANLVHWLRKRTNGVTILP